MTISWFKEILVVSIMAVNSLSSPLVLFCLHAALKAHFLPMGRSLRAPTNGSFIALSSINLKKNDSEAPSLWVVKGGFGEHPETWRKPIFILLKGTKSILYMYVNLLTHFKRFRGSKWIKLKFWNRRLLGETLWKRKKQKWKELSWCPVYGGWFFTPLMHSASSRGFS